MEALEILRERKRMCNSYKSCNECPLQKEKCRPNILTTDEECKKIITAVEKWSKENPVKTRQTEFLKMFPNALMRSDGYLNVAPCVLDEEIYRKCSERSPMKCDECYKEFWGKEVE